ncbi:hypothetical protein [Carboxydothermus ferrireducens]|uniref:Uncharacterized protein n=1 Tax=Carboxydothermus hydrogenoformans (strain ATCC BAA-161 / DSM 6008 / Z-2901) TaxID=246194 RepID=Q3ABD1_CARHZ|nr:hypothetical protein [Carboxydothermus ferrireducens]ABB14142.1 hypothetical protein CHY_1733 [Carboxydothermus hydrogenoformans Z-2901]
MNDLQCKTLDFGEKTTGLIFAVDQIREGLLKNKKGGEGSD